MNDTMNGAFAAFAGFFAVLGIVCFVLAIILIVARWKMFVKAGEAGWKVLIPFYSTYVEYSLFWNGKMGIIMIILPLIASFLQGFAANNKIIGVLCILLYVVMIVVSFVLCFRTSSCFGRGVGTGLGLVFLPFIFYPILGFGSSVYSPLPSDESNPFNDIANPMG